MRFLWRKLFIASNLPNPYFIWNCFIKIKRVFDWINSCPVWKFILNQNWHCCSRARPSSFLLPDRPTLSCAAHVRRPPLASARHRTPPDQRPSPSLLRSYRDAGPHSPPASAWRRPHRTPPPLPLTRMTEPALPSFPFPCSDIEAAESSTVVTSGPRKMPRLSTPHHFSGLPWPHSSSLATGPPSPHRNHAGAPPPTLFGELRPACRSSSFGSCLMTAYHRQCRRSSPKPPRATIRLLHRQAPSSRLASATLTVTRHLGETHHPSPCLAHAPWFPLACVGHLLPPRPLVRRRWSRRRVGSGRGDLPEHAPNAPRQPVWLGHSGRGQHAASVVWPSELSEPPARECRRPNVKPGTVRLF
jgi:hypothetical protein